MPTVDDLKTTFWYAVGYFNGDNFSDANFDAYKPAENIRMKKINDPSYHEALSAVKAYYLHNGNMDKAWFIPEGIPANLQKANMPSPPSSKLGGPDFVAFDAYGCVSGLATFVDKTDGSKPATAPRPIAYSFIYTIVNNEWRAVHLWGKFLDGK